MASVVPGARDAGSCCVACFAAAATVDTITTAAVGKIIAGGLCMLVASHVQRSRSPATHLSFFVIDGRITSILRRLAAGHHQRFLQLCFWRVCCCRSGPAALNSWMCTLVWRSGRLSSMAAFSTTFRTGRRWPRWPLDHLLRDRPVFRRLKVCGWRASNSPGIQC